MAFELWEQLNWRVSDNIVIPIGEVSIAWGIYLGFTELIKDNKIKNMSKIFSIQAKNCDPLKKKHSNEI